MRPGYLSGYGEDTSRPGNLGYSVIGPDSPEDGMTFFARNRFPREIETGYLPEYIKYRKKWYGAGLTPRTMYVPGMPYVQPRDPRTFNVLTI